MSHPLGAIGRATIEIIGFNPTEFGYRSEAVWPDEQIFGREPLYQPTGMGERVLNGRCACRPHITGGLENYAALKAHHERQDVVPFIRLGAGLVGEVQGMVFVRTLGHTEAKLAPDGKGYRHEFEIELVFAGNGGGF